MRKKIGVIVIVTGAIAAWAAFGTYEAENMEALQCLLQATAGALMAKVGYLIGGWKDGKSSRGTSGRTRRSRNAHKRAA